MSSNSSLGYSYEWVAAEYDYGVTAASLDPYDHTVRSLCGPRYETEQSHSPVHNFVVVKVRKGTSELCNPETDSVLGKGAQLVQMIWREGYGEVEAGVTAVCECDTDWRTSFVLCEWVSEWTSADAVEGAFAFTFAFEDAFADF